MKKIIAMLVITLAQQAFGASEPTPQLAEEIGSLVGFMHGWKLTPKMTMDYCTKLYPEKTESIQSAYSKWVSENKNQLLRVDKYFSDFVPFFARAMKLDRQSAERFMGDMTINNVNEVFRTQPKETTAATCKSYEMYVGMTSASSVIQKLDAAATRLDAIKRQLPERWLSL